MNTPQSKAGNLSQALFSATQRKLLAMLFGQPERSFFTNELIVMTGAGSGAVQRELKRLTESGLVSAFSRGNQKHFQANPASPIFSELCGIVAKTFGLAIPIGHALAPLDPQIHAAFIYGSVAKQTDSAASDIDLMILSDALSYADVMSALGVLEGQLGRQINPTIFSLSDWKKRIHQKSAFASRVRAQEKIWIKGDENALPA